MLLNISNRKKMEEEMIKNAGDIALIENQNKNKGNSGSSGGNK